MGSTFAPPCRNIKKIFPGKGVRAAVTGTHPDVLSSSTARGDAHPGRWRHCGDRFRTGAVMGKGGYRGLIARPRRIGEMPLT